LNRYLSRYAEHAYALMRFFAGTLWFFHGTQKLFGWPGGKASVELASLAGVAGVIETVAGALIAVGLFGSWAAFLASGTMAVAYFLRHAPDDFFPIVNRGELAVLYCFVFLYIATRGSGAFSVDAVFQGRSLGERPTGPL
jgi:putative oxidoreductase